MKKLIVRFKFENEFDIVLAYRRAITIIEFAGGNVVCQTNFATAVSEICRNALEFAVEREIVYFIETIKGKSYLSASVSDNGSGIDNIDDILYSSLPLTQNKNNKNRGRGILNAKRLVDIFSISTSATGTSVDLKMMLSPKQPITDKKIEEWSNFFINKAPSSPYENIKHRNTQLIELADALRQSEEQYKFLTESVSIMIFSLNSEGALTFVNSWMPVFFGMSATKMIGSKKRIFLYSEEKDDIQKKWADAQKNKTKFNQQVRLKNKSGELIWHELIITPFIEKDIVIRWVGTCSDIDAQKKIEETLRENTELQNAKNELQANIQDLNLINSELEQFAFVASHDLQEPLRKINVFSGLLQERYDSILDETGKMYIDKISSATLRMKVLINDLLHFSKQSKRMVNIGTVNLNAEIRETLSDMEVLISEKNAKITVKTLPDIEGDSAQLSRLFQNLISNALKYSDPKRKPVISIDFKLRKDTVDFFIKDNGIGFDQKYESKIFVIFQRLHAKDVYDGTGIGLALCKRIVENHNGTITAEGNPGKGATFIVTLPLKGK